MAFNVNFFLLLAIPKLSLLFYLMGGRYPPPSSLPPGSYANVYECPFWVNLMKMKWGKNLYEIIISIFITAKQSDDGNFLVQFSVNGYENIAE